MQKFHGKSKTPLESGSFNMIEVQGIAKSSPTFKKFIGFWPRESMRNLWCTEAGLKEAVSDWKLSKCLSQWPMLLALCRCGNARGRVSKAFCVPLRTQIKILQLW